MKINKLHGCGNHLIIDGISESNLENLRFIRDLLKELKEVIKMKAISKPIVIWHEDKRKSESGVTGTIFLAESNITIHTYPQKELFFLDIFSCKEFNCDNVIKILKTKLKIKKYNKKLLKRGY